MLVALSMNNVKFGIVAAGGLGILAAFLPFVSMGDQTMSLFGMRSLVAGQVYLTLGCFVVALVVGLLALKKAARWHGIVATLAFGLGVLKNRGNMEGAIGAKLLLIAALLGLVASVIVLVKPEK